MKEWLVLYKNWIVAGIVVVAILLFLRGCDNGRSPFGIGFDDGEPVLVDMKTKEILELEPCGSEFQDACEIFNTPNVVEELFNVTVVQTRRDTNSVRCCTTTIRGGKKKQKCETKPGNSCS